MVNMNEYRLRVKYKRKVLVSFIIFDSERYYNGGGDRKIKDRVNHYSDNHTIHSLHKLLEDSIVISEEKALEYLDMKYKDIFLCHIKKDFPEALI